MDKDLVPIGKVTKPHGIRGKIKVAYYGEDFSRFPLYRNVYIENRVGRPKAYEILEAISQPPGIILQLKGIEKIEEAKPLAGKEILVRKEVLPDLPDLDRSGSGRHLHDHVGGGNGRCATGRRRESVGSAPSCRRGVSRGPPHTCRSRPPQKACGLLGLGHCVR